ncbi:putative cystathionine gamma-synthase KNAG_0M00330 [Huiozyma naganishii CBS 8797]|uniref:Cystathionine gamma-synthase n=1 Tax=Huiozyma naganishii (strain ATCC MYA-139 / BCRC 22969 / CBS 8797 / KCTC 17520 / NBRC 10181 / NCYC 3082 / Yp74L-3) TaxID=1071383 RepID=J7SBA2_HUIN7|nr:hypothetical protein KNAG_0M00330 [Kazachstania naganishii CBS 8797]CCK72886.1 hypothetical protein KNAG_0M00330 [Kazachstania naganishii CBS 8797]
MSGSVPLQADVLPSGSEHYVALSLPRWGDVEEYARKRSSVAAGAAGYEESGLHRYVARLTRVLRDKYAKEREECLCFPSYTVAKRCREYIRVAVAGSEGARNAKVRILQLSTARPLTDEEASSKKECKIAVAFVAGPYFTHMLDYWRLSGEMVSSRVAKYVLHELFMIEKSQAVASSSTSGHRGENEEKDFIESRYGRQVNFTFAATAERLVKKRIATKMVDLDDEATLTNSTPVLDMDIVALQMHQHSDYDDDDDDDDYGNVGVAGENIQSLVPAESMSVEVNTIDNGSVADAHVNPETDIFLFASGMASLYTTVRLLTKLDEQRQTLRNNRGTASPGPEQHSKKTVVLGVPCHDTYEMVTTLSKSYFIPENGTDGLSKLKEILHSGEQILAVITETPTNGLLDVTNLVELKQLSELFGFYIVVDESVGGFVNVDALVYCDIVCSSLVKMFSGTEDVVSGSMVVNPQSKLYDFAQTFMASEHEPSSVLWCEDIIQLEQNSRDFVSKSKRINTATKRLLRDVILPQRGTIFTEVHHPSITDRAQYNLIKGKQDGGYGGVFAVQFSTLERARSFYDRLNVCKGPGLGGDYTVACPWQLLNQYDEVDKTLIRVSVGLEDYDVLKRAFEEAIAA